MGKKNQIEICRLCNHKNDITEKIELKTAIKNILV